MLSYSDRRDNVDHSLFANQLKTLPEPELIPMKAKVPKHAQKASDTYGRPDFDAIPKMRGALPTFAKPSEQ